MFFWQFWEKQNVSGEFSDLILGVGLKEFLFANVSEAENEVGRFSGTESLAGIIIK